MNRYDSDGMGNLTRNGRPLIASTYFVYNASFEALNSGTAQTKSINIQSDSDFELIKMTQFTSEAGNAGFNVNGQIIPLAKFQLVDGGSGQHLFDNPTPVPAVFGSGELPFILPERRVFAANATLHLELTNFSSDTNYDIDLALIGRKLYFG